MMRTSPHTRRVTTHWSRSLTRGTITNDCIPAYATKRPHNSSRICYALGEQHKPHVHFISSSSLLEKPPKLYNAALQDVIAISTNVVRTMSGFLFNEILSRIPIVTWSRRYSSDRARFRKYYVLFADNTSTTPSLPAKTLYQQFLIEINNFNP